MWSSRHAILLLIYCIDFKSVKANLHTFQGTGEQGSRLILLFPAAECVREVTRQHPVVEWNYRGESTTGVTFFSLKNN